MGGAQLQIAWPFTLWLTLPGVVRLSISSGNLSRYNIMCTAEFLARVQNGEDLGAPLRLPKADEIRCVNPTGFVPSQLQLYTLSQPCNSTVSYA